jgi:hypothetical protein
MYLSVTGKSERIDWFIVVEETFGDTDCTPGLKSEVFVQAMPASVRD